MIRNTNHYKFVKSKAFGLCSVALAAFVLAANAPVASADDYTYDPNGTSADDNPYGYIPDTGGSPVPPLVDDPTTPASSEPETPATATSESQASEAATSESQAGSESVVPATVTGDTLKNLTPLATAPSGIGQKDWDNLLKNLADQNANLEAKEEAIKAVPVRDISRDSEVSSTITINHAKDTAVNNKDTSVNIVTSIKKSVNAGDFIVYNFENISPAGFLNTDETGKKAPKKAFVGDRYVGDVYLVNEESKAGDQISGRVEKTSTAGGFSGSLVLIFNQLVEVAGAKPNLVSLESNNVVEGVTMVEKETPIEARVTVGNDTESQTITLQKPATLYPQPTHTRLEPGYNHVVVDKDSGAVTTNTARVVLFSNPDQSEALKNDDEMTLTLLNDEGLVFNVDSIQKQYVDTGVVLRANQARQVYEDTPVNSHDADKGIYLTQSGYLNVIVTKVTPDSITVKVGDGQGNIGKIVVPYLDANGDVQVRDGVPRGNYVVTIDKAWAVKKDPKKPTADLTADDIKEFTEITDLPKGTFTATTLTPTPTQSTSPQHQTTDHPDVMTYSSNGLNPEQFYTNRIVVTRKTTDGKIVFVENELTYSGEGQDQERLDNDTYDVTSQIPETIKHVENGVEKVYKLVKVTVNPSSQAQSATVSAADKESLTKGTVLPGNKDIKSLYEDYKNPGTLYTATHENGQWTLKELVFKDIDTKVDDETVKVSDDQKRRSVSFGETITVSDAEFAKDWQNLLVRKIFKLTELTAEYELAEGSVIVHYVDENGNTIKDDYTDTENKPAGESYNAAENPLTPDAEGYDPYAGEKPAKISFNGKEYGFVDQRGASETGEVAGGQTLEVTYVYREIVQEIPNDFPTYDLPELYIPIVPGNPGTPEDPENPTPDEPGQPGEPGEPGEPTSNVPGTPGEEGNTPGASTPVAEETLPNTGDASNLLAVYGGFALGAYGIMMSRKRKADK